MFADLNYTSQRSTRPFHIIPQSNRADHGQEGPLRLHPASKTAADGAAAAAADTVDVVDCVVVHAAAASDDASHA